MRHLVDPNDVPVLVEIGETTGKRDKHDAKHTRCHDPVHGHHDRRCGWSGAPWRAYGIWHRSICWRSEVAQRSGTELTPLDPLHAPEEVRGLIDADQPPDGARFDPWWNRKATSSPTPRISCARPLAGLNLQAQRASKASTPETLDACLADVEASAARASHLIEQMLVLAKAEAVDPTTDGQPVNLGAVARQVIERFLPLADQRRMDLGYEGDVPDVTWRATRCCSPKCSATSSTTPCVTTGTAAA